MRSGRRLHATGAFRSRRRARARVDPRTDLGCLHALERRRDPGREVSEEPPWEVIEVIPTLGVGDLGEAVEFYQGLGFTREWSYPSEGEPEQVGLAIGPITVMLSLCHDPPAELQRQNLYVVMGSLSEYHAELQRSLGDRLTDIVESDYGMRDFSIRDAWGHLLTFGEKC